MKKNFGALILILIVSFNGLGQDRTFGRSERTLFGPMMLKGGFISADLKSTEIETTPGTFIGAKAGLVFGHKLNVGVAGYGLFSDLKSDYIDVQGNEYFYEMGYGGLLLEPVLASDRIVHLTFPIVLGVGASHLSQQRIIYDPNFQWEFDENLTQTFLVAEPGVNLEINLFSMMRLDLGVSYRAVNDVSLLVAPNQTFSGLNANIGLKLGWF